MTEATLTNDAKLFDRRAWREFGKRPDRDGSKLNVSVGFAVNKGIQQRSKLTKPPESGKARSCYTDVYLVIGKQSCQLFVNSP